MQKLQADTPTEIVNLDSPESVMAGSPERAPSVAKFTIGLDGQNLHMWSDLNKI